MLYLCVDTSRKIRTLIIEDEEASRETLRNYLGKYCPEVEILEECKNIIEGKAAIDLHQPDLIFLDVEMPFGNAFDLLEQIEDVNFEVIFVTAYSQYALKAINYSASYYILKPIDIDELEAAVEKVKENLSKSAPTDANLQTKVLLEHIAAKESQNKKIVLPLIDGFDVVDVDEIVRCEANDNFTNVILKDGSKKMICRTLKFYDEILSEIGFMRVHRSHLINLNYIKSYKKGKGGQVVMIDGSYVDVAPSKKAELIAFFN
ncbi:MAG: two-component system LytT family response regulator [Parvicella sp.]|jgi:two-component system LytT family response regulator